MILFLRENTTVKKLSIALCITFVYQLTFPTISYALTGGPSQPEVQSFEPIGTSEMVDLSSGDFTYNIPLIDVGGYPINLSYHSGMSMDQEASWVGLGWNINPGVINRNMRSLPDDFNGDEITKEMNVKANETYGARGNVSLEVIGAELNTPGLNLGLGLGLSYNNYTGVGMEVSYNPSISSAKRAKTKKTAGLGISAGTDGVGIKPTVSFTRNTEKTEKGTNEITGSIGLPYNSRGGLMALNVEAGFENTKIKKKEKKNKETGEKESKLKKFTRGTNGGSAISFTAPSYTPQVNMNMLNTSVSVTATLGGEFFGLHGNAKLTGYYTGQYLLSKEEKVPAYGYMYSEKSNGKNKLLMDFNREKDGAFTKNTPNLPLTNFTYDVYSVSGQGIGGMYRPHRSDIGVIADNQVRTISGGIDLGGIELGGGNAVRGGVNLTLNTTNAVSGRWTADNDVNNVLAFKGPKTADPYYEPYYFKQAGEKTTESDPGFLAKIGGTDAVRVDLNKKIEDVPAKKTYIKADGSTLAISNDNQRNARQKRNEVISILSAEQASKYGLEKTINNYPLNTFTMAATGSYSGATPIVRTSNPAHHISEIAVNRADGARYIYGIPAYNMTKEEVSFAITGGSPNCATGLVGYNHGTDDSKENKKGLDHFYSRTITPKYAHSYLLTGILSVDYVDVDDNGPSDQDIGSYTKFNYTRAYSNYKWRVPIEADKANYSEGLRSKKNSDAKGDDKASYIYGEKELWYVHSIETKSHVAEFILGNRTDGKEAAGKSGGAGTNSMKRLDRIDVYSKADKIANGANAVPIKSVHFKYKATGLCQGITNGSAGKLTLDEVYFTYGNSKRGQLNPYKFTYGQYHKTNSTTDIIDPSYNLKGYDRWGNYAPNNGPTACNSNTTLTTSEFPYVQQGTVPASHLNYDAGNPGKLEADLNAIAWNMTQIDLPSGGTIHVEYEADDYAFVQDKRAMQMFRVVGSSEEPPQMFNIGGEVLYNGNSPNDYMILELSKSYPTTATAADFKRDFLTDERGRLIDQMYFRYLVNLAGSTGSSAKEFVSGYSPLQFNTGDYGFVPNGGSDFTHAYVRLKPLTTGDGFPNTAQVNRVSMAAWNFTKLHLPRIAYNKPDINSNAVLQVLQALVSTVTSMTQFIAGANNVLRIAENSRKFDPDKSWVRLYNPDQFKKGGGVRVKQISINDEWSTLTNVPAHADAIYGQTYDYTTINAYGKKISSGVASYEPLIGGEENPFRQPVFFSEDKLLVPDDEHFLEQPFGESFFPSASVVYSQVTVKNLQYANVTQNATGKMVHEFYTAKDFPTIAKQTILKPIRKKPNPLLKLLKVKSRDFMTTSQGYAIELNDMHGKSKGQWVYQEGKEEPISGIQYHYNMAKTKRLSNTVNTIDKAGVIGENEVGMEYDFVVDMREHSTEVVNTGNNGSLDAFLAAIFPLAVPMLLPSYTKEKTRYRSAVTTKVINRYGILTKTEAFDLGAVVASENLLFDQETGEVLLTKVTNNYKDPVYSFSYPAHWGYEKMGPSYVNTGMKLDASTHNLATYLEVGDEIGIGIQKGWVTQNDAQLVILDKNGTQIATPTSGEVIVLRSARRNQQNTPIGKISVRTNPMFDSDSDGNPDQLAFNNILKAEMTEYAEESGEFCECGVTPVSTYNPYIKGLKGYWKPVKQHLYLTGRTQSMVNNNVNIREDGEYVTFSPFWTPNAGNDWASNSTGWTSTSEVTLFSPNGAELETKNALGQHNAANFGFNQTLPKATATNAQYQELGYDGFEDYDNGGCADDHFNYKQEVTETVGVSITEEDAHTGRRSIKVTSGKSIQLKRFLEP